MNQLTIIKGEILTAEDDVRVFCNPDLVNNRRIELSLPVGLTVHEIVDKAIERCNSRWPARDFDVLLNGHEILYDRWHLVRPKPQTTLTMHVVPKGIISSIIGAISWAVSSFTALIGSLGFLGKLIMAGIGIAVKFLLNKLFAPKQPDSLPEPKVSYSVIGSRNSFNAYEVVPVILGEHRVTPGFACAPFTENIGDEQFLHMEFVIGIGPLAISDQKIGETLASQYEDILIETREGRVGDPATTLYPTQVTEEQLSVVLNFADGFIQRTSATGVNVLSVDFTWPRGGGVLNDNGGLDPLTMYIRIEYKLVSVGGWSVFPADQAFVFSTQDTKRRTVQWNVASGQYDVRVSRLTPDYTDSKVIDDVQWTALRGYRTGSPITFTVPIAKVAMRVRGTGQLNGIIDQFNCIARSYVNAYVGGVWTPNTISRENADLFRAVLQHPANRRPVPDAQIDLVSLQAWRAYCITQGFHYDKPVVRETSVYDQLHEIAACGRAMPVWKDGKWSVVWDEQNPPITQMFTPRNSWDFQEVRQYKKIKLHGVRIQFVNRAKRYAGDELVVYNDGYNKANATELTAMEMQGCVDANAIWKHGRFFLAQDELRPGLYNLSCNWEGMQLTRNDRIYVNHDVLMVGLGDGRVKAVVDVATDLITLSTPLTLDPAKAYGFQFRLRDGSFVQRSVVLATSGTDLTVIPLIGTGSLPAVGDLYAFGEVNSEVATYRVLGIEPTRDYHFRLTLVDDAPAISLADTGVIPEFDAFITVPPDPYEMPPVNLRIGGDIHQDGLVFYELINLSWSNPKLGKVTGFEVRYYSYTTGVWEKAPTVPAPGNSTIIRRLSSGIYKASVRSIFNDGTFSQWVYSADYSANKLTEAPPDVTNFLIQTNGPTSTLTWDPISTAYTTFEIRYADPDVVSPLWNTAIPIFQNISGTSVQIPTNVGTYFIKATSVGGRQSVNARSIYTNITGIFDINVVATLTEGPNFLGTHDDAITVANNQLSLTTSNTMDKWESLSTVVDLLYGDYADDTVGFMAVSGYYYFANKINLDDVYTVRMTGLVEGSGYDPYTTMDTWVALDQVLSLDNGDAGKWGTQLEYRSTDIDDVVGPWTEWKPFFIGDASFMAAEFRVKLFGTPSPNPENLIAITTPLVTRAEVVIDMPDRVEKGEDQLIPAGGMDIVFAYPFRGPDPLNILITPQNMLTGEKVIVTKTPGDLTKFHVQAKNSAETGIGTVKIDWTAIGYGRIHP